MSEHNSAQLWKDRLHMQPHPEGGFYIQTYACEDIVPHGALAERYHDPRHISTAIYFLLHGSQKSRLHRLRSDELWHFYAGVTLIVHEITPSGIHWGHQLGPDWDKGEHFQLTIRHGSWFGAELLNPARDNWALVGNTVAPGFDFVDFELGDTEILVKEFPQHERLIRKLQS